MDVTIQTGTTKAVSGVSLVALSFSGNGGEEAFLLLQIEAAGRDAKTLEVESAAVIKTALLGSEGEAWHRLDGTLKELNGLFKGLLVSGTVDDIHAILGLVDGAGTLHVSHTGRAEAYLVRKGSASQITEYSKGKPVPMFVHISSGALEPRDTVIISTQRLLRTITPAQLSQMVQRGEGVLQEITTQLNGEKESAALAALHIAGRGVQSTLDETPALSSRLSLRGSRRGRRGRRFTLPSLAFLTPLATRLRERLPHGGVRMPSLSLFTQWTLSLRERAVEFLADLRDPDRKRRAHLLLLAGAVAAFLIVWAVVRLSTFSQHSKTRAELAQLVEQISADIQTADNKRVMGDLDTADAILQKASDRAKQVMDSNSGLFRVEALDLLDRIRAKREEMLNIVRITPRTVVNIASKTAAVVTQGLIRIGDSEFAVYDRQDVYRILLNSIEDPRRISDEELVLAGASFPRVKSLAFLTNGNSLVEVAGNQTQTMKTEDPAGWTKGTDIETYLRNLYILSPENNQIYKYERLSNRYAAPVGYNVNGDLKGAIDMTIDSSIYVLKNGGQIVKLFRGESRPFVIRHAPDNVLQDATKVFKVPGGNLYVLDPTRSRIVVVSDGGETGEASYVRQYVVEGVGKLQDFTVDSDESRIYVLDEKKVYAIDVVK